MSALMAVDTSELGLPMPATGMIKPDWMFEMKGFTGRRKFIFNNPPPGWSLKSVTVDGTDVIDTGLEVKAGEEVANVEVVLTKRTTELSGTVHHAKGAAVPDFAVVLFSTDSQQLGYTRYVRVGRADQTGRFLISGLPPPFRTPPWRSSTWNRVRSRTRNSSTASRASARLFGWMKERRRH
jgi:hypothetical protein